MQKSLAGLTILMLILVTPMAAMTVEDSTDTSGASSAEKQSNVVQILNIKEACRAPVESLEELITISKSKFRITVRDLPGWGHEEEWILKDKDELSRLGLQALLIQIEQNVLQSVMYFPESSLEMNLSLVGLSKDDIEIKTYGELIDVRTEDVEGRPIMISYNGTLYQCFEHHPGH